MRKWLPLLTVCLGTFMLLVDITVVNVALPDMAIDLDTSFASLQWVVDAYSLVLAALVLGTGSIADLIGHRRAYIGGLVLFAVASFVCGVSPNAGVLIAARSVQGLGAATMFATTFALLNSNYTGRDRGTAYGMWGAFAGASSAIGPVVGGLLTQGVSWRWIFFVNLPVSVIAVVLCLRVLKDANAPMKARVDIAGMLTFTGAAAGVTYGLIDANEHSWGHPASWGSFIVGGVMLIAFIVIERRVSQPMIDLQLLRNRTFTGILIAATLMSCSAFAAFTYASIWLQSVIGLSPIEAGLTGLPLSATAFIASLVIGKFMHRAQPGPVIGTGLLIIGSAGILGALLVRDGASWPALVPGFLLLGLGAGLATPILSSAVMTSVSVQRGGMAAGAVSTGRQLGFTLGIATLGTVFSARAAQVLADRHVPNSAEVAKAVTGGQSRELVDAAPAAGRAALESAVHAASAAGMQFSFLVSGVVGLIGAVVVFVLVRTPRPVSDAAPSESAAVAV